MDFFNRHQLKLLLLAIILVLAGIYPAKTKEMFDQLVSKVWPGATSNTATEPAGSPSPVEASARPGASPASDRLSQTQSAVETYMRGHASPDCTLFFLNWSDFSASGPASAVTLRYRVQRPARDDIFAAVRFTVQAGSVVKSQLLGTGLQSAIVPSATPRPLAFARPAAILDRFSGPLFAAMNGPSMTLELNSAFSLAQLDQAKAKAQAEKKPLGFLMVWGQFFDHEADPLGRGSDEALVHFYEVFNQQLVLVFVRHETELGIVPAAVAAGFRGPDEGGYAPNMAVTDATATEFIVEIPYKDLDAAGRTPIFAEGGRKIDLWLATHPDAVPTPAPAAQ
jgi:hypothetical protein